MCPSSPPSEPLSRIDFAISSAISNRLFAGAVLLVSLNDEVVVEKAYGHNVASATSSIAQTAMTTGHVFDVASITKAFAGTLAAMLLYDDGMLDLAAPVAAYLPSFANAPDKQEVLVHHLLSHRSGLPAWAPLQCLVSERTQVVPYVASLALESSPGTQRVYSDLGYMILGCIIESLAGERLDLFLNRRVYQPLMLTRTAFNPKRKCIEPIVPTSHGNAFEQDMVAQLSLQSAYSSARNFDGWRDYLLAGEVNDANAFHALDGVSAHAGLFSNASDLRILTSLIQNNGIYQDQRIFSSATCKAFMAPQLSDFGWISREGKASLAPFNSPLLPPETLFAQGFTGTFALATSNPKLSVIFLSSRVQMPRGPDGAYADLRPVFGAILEAARVI